MANEIAGARRGHDIATWYRGLLEVETDVTDTHPSIAERISHLGLEPADVLRLATADVRRSAASTYLARRSLVYWRRSTTRGTSTSRPSGASTTNRLSASGEELDQLDARDSLPPDEALRRAQLTETFRSAEQRSRGTASSSALRTTRPHATQWAACCSAGRTSKV